MADAILQILPEGDPQFATGFLQRDKGIARLSSLFRTGGATDVAAFDVFADISFAEIVMQRNLRVLQDQQ